MTRKRQERHAVNGTELGAVVGAIIYGVTMVIGTILGWW